MKSIYWMKVLLNRALLTMLFVVSSGGVLCRLAEADDDALYSNPSSDVFTLSVNDGNGQVADPPPASSGGGQGGGDMRGGGEEDPVDPWGSTGSNETPPCENRSGGGFTSILFFVARFLNPCP